MSSLVGKCAGCLVLLFALCLVADARRPARLVARRQAAHPPLKQTLFEFPMDQVNPSVMNPSISETNSVSSESSEVDSFDDMDNDADIDGEDGLVAGGVNAGGANQVGGNLPFVFGNAGNGVGMDAAGDSDLLMARNAGSSGKGVGIAFGVLGLLAVVVAAAAFTLRKYRHSIPVVVRT